MNAPQGMSKWSANFQLKGQRSRSLDVKNLKKTAAYLAYVTLLLTGGGRRLRRQLQTRPNPLLGLDNWTDGRI